MTTYLVLKTVHLVCFSLWAAAMSFLPFLYASHVAVPEKSETDRLLQAQEHALLRRVINPAMILTLLVGLLLIKQAPDIMKMGWMHAKMMLVLGMVLLHAFLARTRRHFASGATLQHKRHSPRFYRMLGLISALFFIGMVALAVIKPF